MRILTILVVAPSFALSTIALAAAGDPLTGSPPASEAKSARIDLNTASLEVLVTLEGVTKERARAIVENRESRCYESAAELLDRKIMPKAAYDKIKDKVTTGPCGRGELPAAASPAKGGK